MVNPLSSQIAFIIKTSVCLYELSYERAPMLSLSLKCQSIDMVHPLGSHIVFIIEISIWLTL